MKRSIVTTGLLILILLGLVFGVLFLNDPEAFSKKTDLNEAPEVKAERIAFPVLSGTIEYTKSVSGRVISGEPEVYERRIELLPNAECKPVLDMEPLSVFSKGDIIAHYGDKPIKAEFNGRITEIISEDSGASTIVALDQDALITEFYLETDIALQLDYSTPVRIERDNKTYPAYISKIGYEVQEGMIKAELKSEARLLPGMEVTATFVVGKREAGVYVPEEAVFTDTDGAAYTFREDAESNALVRIPLVLGEHFTIEEDGAEFSYWEIISGVNEGEMLTVEFFGEPPKNIARIVENERIDRP